MHRFQRIAIVGTSGTGKTTLAQQVGRQLGIAHIELDALHWEPN
ncbi:MULTISPECIES: AAA family ATPase [Thermoleptolyngbya]|nr:MULTISPECIES: AAA family ATPase [Thermoleptolyngbya]